MSAQKVAAERAALVAALKDIAKPALSGKRQQRIAQQALQAIGQWDAPVLPGKRGPYKGGSTLRARAAAAGVPYTTVVGRVYTKGMTVDEAIAAGPPRKGLRSVFADGTLKVQE